MTVLNDSAKLFYDASLAGTLAASPATQAASATGGWTYNNITTDTTTVVKSGAGRLKAVVINTKGITASTVTIYDNTSAAGNKIATIDSLNLSGVFEFDAACLLGITVVTTGTPNVTVLFK